MLSEKFYAFCRKTCYSWCIACNSYNISGFCCFDHISSVLKDELHWLPVEYRIRYKLALLVYKCLHGTDPSYLTDIYTHTHIFICFYFRVICLVLWRNIYRLSNLLCGSVLGPQWHNMPRAQYIFTRLANTKSLNIFVSSCKNNNCHLLKYNSLHTLLFNLLYMFCNYRYFQMSIANKTKPKQLIEQRNVFSSDTQIWK